MSHPNNDTYLEYAKVEFESAQTRLEREDVVQRLRDEGFTTQAEFLEQFVETGEIVAPEQEAAPRPKDKPEEKDYS